MRGAIMAKLIAIFALLWAWMAEAQTLPLPPGAGFEWEQVGDEGVGAADLWFDAGGTLWVPERPPIGWTCGAGGPVSGSSPIRRIRSRSATRC